MLSVLGWELKGVLLVSSGMLLVSNSVLPVLPRSVGNVLRRLALGGAPVESLGEEAPPFFTDNGILKAAPKKKVSHMKKRQKWLAPAKKQLKFLHHLNRCPTCGSYKRSHHICMTCFTQIRNYWKSQAPKEEPYKEEFVNERDEQILYPGKVERAEERMLRKKSYLVNRHKTLPVEKK